MKFIVVLSALTSLLSTMAMANPFMTGIYFADGHIQDLTAAGALLAGGLGTLAIGAKYINSGLPQAFKLLPQAPLYNQRHVQHEPIVKTIGQKVIRIPLVQHVKHETVVKAPEKIIHKVVPVAEKVAVAEPEPEVLLAEPEAEWYPYAELEAFPESQTVVVDSEPEVSVVAEPEADVTVGLAGPEDYYGEMIDFYGAKMAKAKAAKAKAAARARAAAAAKGAARAASASRLSPVRAKKHNTYYSSARQYAGSASEEVAIAVEAPKETVIAKPDLTKDVPRRR